MPVRFVGVAGGRSCVSLDTMSGRTSPGGGSSCPNKSVAFCKPPSTVIPAESPVGSNSGLTRMGPNFGGASGSNPTPAAGHQPSPSLRVGPRLRAEGLMVPPASDAATLRRQVAALQIDLEAHIDGEQRLQSINQQLRERCLLPLHSFPLGSVDEVTSISMSVF